MYCLLIGGKCIGGAVDVVLMSNKMNKGKEMNTLDVIQLLSNTMGLINKLCRSLFYPALMIPKGKKQKDKTLTL